MEFGSLFFIAFYQILITRFMQIWCFGYDSFLPCKKIKKMFAEVDNEFTLGMLHDFHGAWITNINPC